MNGRILGRGLVWIVILLAATGCTASRPIESDPDAAAEVVEQFLVTAGDPVSVNRGWSLIHPDLQQGMFEGDPLAYVETAAASQWSAFAWSVAEVVEEDRGLYMVYLDVLDRDAIPAILTARRNGYALLAGADDRERPHLDVRFSEGGSGIWGVGG